MDLVRVTVIREYPLFLFQAIFEITIRRNPLYYIYMIVFPSFVINFVSIVGVFLNGADKMSRVSYVDCGLQKFSVMRITYQGGYCVWTVNACIPISEKKLKIPAQRGSHQHHDNDIHPRCNGWQNPSYWKYSITWNLYHYQSGHYAYCNSYSDCDNRIEKMGDTKVKTEEDSVEVSREIKNFQEFINMNTSPVVDYL